MTGSFSRWNRAPRWQRYLPAKPVRLSQLWGVYTCGCVVLEDGGQACRFILTKATLSPNLHVNSPKQVGTWKPWAKYCPLAVKSPDLGTFKFSFQFLHTPWSCGKGRGWNWGGWKWRRRGPVCWPTSPPKFWQHVTKLPVTGGPFISRINQKL